MKIIKFLCQALVVFSLFLLIGKNIQLAVGILLVAVIILYEIVLAEKDKFEKLLTELDSAEEAFFHVTVSICPNWNRLYPILQKQNIDSHTDKIEWKTNWGSKFKECEAIHIIYKSNLLMHPYSSFQRAIYFYVNDGGSSHDIQFIDRCLSVNDKIIARFYFETTPLVEGDIPKENIHILNIEAVIHTMLDNVVQLEYQKKLFTKEVLSKIGIDKKIVLYNGVCQNWKMVEDSCYDAFFECDYLDVHIQVSKT